MNINFYFTSTCKFSQISDVSYILYKKIGCTLITTHSVSKKKQNIRLFKKKSFKS